MTAPRCSNCAYDLSGLATSSIRLTCPECGHKGPHGVRLPFPWGAIITAPIVGFSIMTAVIIAMMQIDRLPISIRGLYAGPFIATVAAAAIALSPLCRRGRILHPRARWSAVLIVFFVLVISLLAAAFFVMVLEGIHG